MGWNRTNGPAGTLEDPIVVNSAGSEQYVGCTGSPADSHNVLWITVSYQCIVSLLIMLKLMKIS